MTQAHTLEWTNPTARADGSAYTQSMNAGYEVEIDGGSPITLPNLTWGTSFDLSTLPIWSTLAVGTHTAAIAVVDTGGIVSGFGSATFPVFSKSAPLAPTAVSVV